jgi:hypothetical protein
VRHSVTGTFLPGGNTPILAPMSGKELAHQHAVYSYGALPLTLMYSPTAAAAWEVYYGGEYLGLVEEVRVPGELWPTFRARLPGEEELGDGAAVRDWRIAVEMLAAQAGL